MSAQPCRSHDVATVESFAKDPEYAAAYLEAVLADGDEEELQVAVVRLSKASIGDFAA
jgi:DNA-binding phage protein